MSENENPQESGFVLRSGMYPTCTGIFDEKTNSFKSADLTEIAKCCTNYCIETHKSCLNFQNNSAICDKNRELCMGTCLVDSQFISENSPYMRCINSCSNPTDPDCKEQIYNCCKHKCIPGKYIDCQTFCEYSKIITTDPTYLPYSVHKPRQLENKLIIANKHHIKTIIIPIIIPIIVSIILMIAIMQF